MWWKFTLRGEPWDGKTLQWTIRPCAATSLVDFLRPPLRLIASLIE